MELESHRLADFGKRLKKCIMAFFGVGGRGVRGTQMSAKISHRVLEKIVFQCKAFVMCYGS